VTSAEMDEGRVYPNLNRVQEVSRKIALDVIKHANSQNLCLKKEDPEKFEEAINANFYNPNY
jgi:malic enzyme